MKTRRILTFFFLITSLSLFAQTKLISHKSHSGNTSNFAIALESNLFDIKDSNFGVAPVRYIEKAQLDSLIFLSDTAVIMVTSELCEITSITKPKRKQRVLDKRVWSAGKDTVFHHQLFTRTNSIEEIKKKLEQDYFFKNPVDSVKFINHEVPQKLKKKNKINSKKARKERRQKRKQERRERRWAKKNCDCDCDCDNNENTNQEESQNNNSENQNPKSEANQNIKMQMLPSVSAIGLLALLLGIVITKWQNRI